MYQESRFQDDVTGYNTNGTTDGGLMQLNSRYAEYLCQRFGADDLRDPYQNIEVGVRLLAVVHPPVMGNTMHCWPITWERAPCCP